MACDKIGGVGTVNPGKASSLEGAIMTPPAPLYREIPITQGQVTIVDAADYEWLSQWKWYATWSNFTQSYYVGRQIPAIGRRGQMGVRMHRMILGLEFGDPLMGDHINRDTLDNRRVNLRKATRAQNGHNSKKRKNNTSGLTSVYMVKPHNKFRVEFRNEGKKIHVGYFPTEELARAAYREAIIRLRGEFASVA